MKRIVGKATYRAHANIAFIKYWGTRDSDLNLPLTHSLSMTLSHAHTTTTVEWREGSGLDAISINGVKCVGAARQRIVDHLDRIRHSLPQSLTARVCSRNSFPTSAGIASSASGFCALTLAAYAGLHGKVRDQDIQPLARLARLASGSACRSFYGGFVEWLAGDDHESSVPVQLHEASHWNLLDFVVVVSTSEKAVSSQEGHKLASSSFLLPSRLEHVNQIWSVVKAAVHSRDLTTLGSMAETDALFMHAVMLTSRPPLVYLNSDSIKLIHAILAWRDKDALPVYFTVDAGSNIHLLCESHLRDELLQRLGELEYVQQVIVNYPGPNPIQLIRHLV